MVKRHIRLFFCFILIWINVSFDVFAPDQTFSAANNVLNNTVHSNKPLKSPTLLPSLVISQREIDLGTLSMGQEKEGSFSIKNIGGDSLAWAILSPEFWFPLDKTELLGISVGNEEIVNLRISVIKKDDDVPEDNRSSNFPVQLTLENRSNRLICVRDLPAGFHRDTIRIQTPSGIKKTVFIKFNLLPDMQDTSIVVNPPRLDLGTIKTGEQATKRIRLTNKSSDNVKWQTSLADLTGTTSNLSLDRYISFANDDVVGKVTYTIPTRMDKQLKLWGSWREYQGFPSISGKSILKLDFYGSSLTLFVKKLNSTGQFSAYIDNNFIKSYELSYTDEDYDFYEIPIIDNLIETNHVLTLALSGNGIAIEGVRIKRQDIVSGKRDWITIFPESGFVLKETDYINITVNPMQANPGIYKNTIHITSNNGNFDVPLSFEIITDLRPKSIDIYRYVKGTNYLYISDLSTEELRLTSKGFVKQGLAFSLLSPGTLGTVPFHRWYNPRIINQYYSYDFNKGNSMLGYVYEGAVGNIATSRLTDTRELYRWFNPKTRQHFFSLDPKGEGMNKNGYLFDGIAGYVK